MSPSLRILDSALVAATAQLGQAAVIGAEGGAWTWRQVHAASVAFARRLALGSTVFNLCESRLGFLVVWLAALRRRCLQLLPPSGGRADLAAIVSSSADPCIVVDRPELLQPEWREHARGLVWEPDFLIDSADDAVLAWSPDWKAELVRLYTSGSTGTPQPQAKTLGQLARGAELLGARLDEDLEGGVASLRSMICSVPPQHMFGLEASVMLPLVHGIPVIDRCPLLPADAAAAFDACTGNAIWVTTPLHLRSLQRAGETLQHCGAVLASTMPLAARLASETEALTAAPVLEIYGSTETGAIAMRRTAREAHWRPLAGVRLESADNGTRVWGLHFRSPQTLADHIAFNQSGGFTLLGRDADLIKIGGRRASLAGLNQLLHEMPGLADGVFYLPSSDAPAERLVLIYQGETLDRQASDAWLRARLDPIFLPRSYIRVDRLPRAGGKLPRAALDAIYSEWRGRSKTVQRLEFDVRIPPDHPALPGHFPGNPIVPGVLLLDTIVANLEHATGCRAVRLQQVKFLAVLRPDESARAECEIEGRTARFRVSTRWGTASVPLASGTISLEREGAASTP